jgi:hypothetical protein
VETTFRDGPVQATGTAITKVLPPESRFLPEGGHDEKTDRAQVRRERHRRGLQVCANTSMTSGSWLAIRRLCPRLRVNWNAWWRRNIGLGFVWFPLVLRPVRHGGVHHRGRWHNPRSQKLRDALLGRNGLGESRLSCPEELEVKIAILDDDCVIRHDELINIEDIIEDSVPPEVFSGTLRVRRHRKDELAGG